MALLRSPPPESATIVAGLFTGEVFWRFFLSEIDGRLLGTRTPDLYRVKGQLTNTLNNLANDRDRQTTPKYV